MGSVFGPVRFLLPVFRLSWFLYTLNIYAHFSSHFSQQLLMTWIWYLVTSFILVPHIVGSVFGSIRFLLPVYRLSWLLYTFNIYAHFSSHFFQQLLMAEIWYLVTTSYRYPISWEAFLDPSDSYFLFADFVDFYAHWTYILYMPIFSRIFLSNYWWQKSDIWSQAFYRYPISWEAFFDPSDSYFLFAEERGYHKWALAHSSSCYICYDHLSKQDNLLLTLLSFRQCSLSLDFLHLKLPTTEPKQVKMCWNGPFLLIYMAAPASIQSGYVLLPKIEIGNFIWQIQPSDLPIIGNID